MALSKDSSNLFRTRRQGVRQRLDVRAFNHVLSVNPAAGELEAEGMVPYDVLAEATLAHGVMPAVVPQLKSITLGGAVAGVGIEATSFKHGLVHDTLLEIEVLTGAGEIVVATPHNEHRDLFFGFPNSYGTLGYALRVRARTVPVTPFVELTHRRFQDPEDCFSALAHLAGSDVDFLDGVVFGADELYLTTGRFVAEAAWVSDYSFERIFYRSIRERERDFLSTAGFIWRWDTDWFWCSKNLGAQNPMIRRALGRSRLNSRFYTRLMRWNDRVGLTRTLDRFQGWRRESVIQDVDIPVQRAAEFLDFFLREVGILPIWLCPIRSRQQEGRFTLFPVDPDMLYVNFGFWDVVRRREPQPTGHFNRMVERKVTELGGIKSLYSDSYFPEAEFYARYGGADYRALKQRYDPQGRLGDLYRKCVLKE